MACEITLNGKVEILEEGVTTVQQLLKSKGVNPTRVAVELNRRILSREEFASTHLRGGDAIEVVTFVGGGCTPS